MFFSGLALLAIALVAAVFAVAPPVEAARAGAIGVMLGCGLAGALLVYLDAPRRRPKTPPGRLRAKATILDAAGTPGAVAGYQMVELTLEVRPKEGMPFQVKRKFSAGRLGRIEQGRNLDVVYDPADPERLELA
ncbi:MAG TPA: hypothetical protein VGO36_04645 [Solirubrobacterales bacterium]|jgi:hypothetical protein|nr:hypothetical protein [Solirubrobacterales bacterium]